MDATDPTPAPGTRMIDRLAKKVGHTVGHYVIPAWAVTTALALTATLIKYLLS